MNPLNSSQSDATNKIMEKCICKKFCSFYKGKKEEDKCGTYKFLKRNLSKGEIKTFSEQAPKTFDRSADKQIKSMVCSQCGYRANDCDYARGLESPPCGGYAVIEHLLKMSRNGDLPF